MSALSSSEITRIESLGSFRVAAQKTLATFNLIQKQLIKDGIPIEDVNVVASNLTIAALSIKS